MVPLPEISELPPPPHPTSATRTNRAAKGIPIRLTTITSTCEARPVRAAPWLRKPTPYRPGSQLHIGRAPWDSRSDVKRAGAPPDGKVARRALIRLGDRRATAG